MNWRFLRGIAFALSGTALFLLFLGTGVAGVIGTQHDDSDCRGHTYLRGDHDERPAGCREICKDGPSWFIWGHHDFCYWDDDEVPA